MILWPSGTLHPLHLPYHSRVTSDLSSLLLSDSLPGVLIVSWPSLAFPSLSFMVREERLLAGWS